MNAMYCFINSEFVGSINRTVSPELRKVLSQMNGSITIGKKFKLLVTNFEGTYEYPRI